MVELADAGDPGSIYRVARCYEEGNGVRKDEERAVQMYQEAIAASGSKTVHSPSLNSLGLCYLDGIGTPRNHDKAVEAFRSASDAGAINSACHVYMNECL